MNKPPALPESEPGLEQILAMASEFVVLEEDRSSPLRRDVRVKRMVQRDGSVKWAVYVSGMIVDRNGDWGFECLPSSRTEEYLAAHRFDTLPEAMRHARRAVEKVFQEREAFLA